MIENRELKYRFIEDMKLPITVMEDGPFEYLVNLYEGMFKTKTLWDEILQGVEKDFGGNPKAFIDSYFQGREALLQGILQSPWYDVFNKKDLQEYSATNKEFDYIPEKLPKNNIYNESKVGQYYLSIDMSRANYQALSSISPDFFTGVPVGPEEGKKPKELYDKWVDAVIGDKCPESVKNYIKKSKHLRVVVFGNTNPSRQMTIEKWMITKAAGPIKEFIGDKGEIITRDNDEIIFALGPDPVEIDWKGLLEVRDRVTAEQQTYVNPQVFFLKSVEYKTVTDQSVRAYLKEFSDGTYEMKGVTKNYMAQIYEDLHGIPPQPDDYDLLFYFENREPVKFLNRITRVLC